MPNKKPSAPRYIEGVKSSPAIRKRIKLPRGRQHNSGGPDESVRNARPERYSQILECGIVGAHMQRDLSAEGDCLKHEMSNPVSTNIKLKTIGFGHVVVNRGAEAARPGQKTSKPHLDVRSDFERRFECVARLSREKSHRIIASRVVANNHRLKRKKGD